MYIAQGYLNEAKQVAKFATCLKSKCGSVIVKNLEIIGMGFNSPPVSLESQRRCLVDKRSYHEKVGDKSCCVHAEQRAINDALRRNEWKIKDSDLYFIRLNLNDEMIFSGKPYCTHCSKNALDVGIKNFILWHKEGITIYDTCEYNDLSYRYR